nr:replication protein [Mute swan feces associated circular virus 11]
MPNRSAHYAVTHHWPAAGADRAIKQGYYQWLSSRCGTKVTNKTKVSYLIYQTEVCPTTHKEHIQWYFQCEGQVDWKKAKAWFTKQGEEHPELCLGDDHFEKCVGSAAQNKTYCSKEASRAPADTGDPPLQQSGEFGEFRDIAGLVGAGSREDIKKLKAAIDDGADVSKLYDDFFGTFARHPQFFNGYMEHVRAKKQLDVLKQSLSGCILRPWQQSLLQTVDAAVCTRTVHWMWETVGNAGKSWMSRYLSVMKNALVLQSMKKADMLHLITKQMLQEAGLGPVVFDLSRTCEDGAVGVIYEVAELLKNGYICSGKYDSKSLSFAPPHVFVFANFEPDKTKLSADRWNIKNIIDDYAEAEAV